MTDRTVLLSLSLLVILCYATIPVASQNQVLVEFWSSWSCNITEASRSRVIANCTTMQDFDSMTNMTNVTTSCVNSTDVETRTDVVSVSLGWSQWLPVIPSCGTMMSVTQSQSMQCSVVNPECSSTCSSRTSTRTRNIPLCCTVLPWNEWTTWTSSTCSSVAAVQTRQRTRDRTQCVNDGDCEDNCANGMENRTVSPTTWNNWGRWSPSGEQLCANGQRIRQRTCPNDSVLYCELDCPLGDAQFETDCCIIQYQWTQWSTWTETQNSDCSGEIVRTRDRTCTVDAEAVTRDVNMTYQCLTGCTLDNVDTAEQDFIPDSCFGNPNSTGDDGFPVWAIGVISAVGVVIVVGGFVIATIVGRTLARRQEYSIGEATIAAQKEYEEMHEPTDGSAPGYRPADSFSFHPGGMPVALDSYEEKQF